MKLLCFCLVACILSTGAMANIDVINKNRHLKHNLKEVKDQIAQHHTQIESLLDQEVHFIQGLRALDTQISDIQKRLSSLGDQLKRHQNTLEGLTQNMTQVREKEATQKARLEATLVRYFKENRLKGLTQVLNQDNLSAMARAHYFHQQYKQSSIAHLNHLLETLQSISAQKKMWEQEQATTLALQDALKVEHLKLAQTKQKRIDHLDKLQEALKHHQVRMTHLKAQEKEIQTLIKGLSPELQISRLDHDLLKRFSKMKGKLSLPISKPKVSLSALPNSKNSPKRFYMPAQEGTPVQSVYSGKVVFAEWLRGLGLLLIIDHGEGYMSLYGNNLTLFKSTGDSVKTGEQIALVGQSGGQPKPGLYFELRKDGAPLDPMKWLKNN